jgi:hypothetical protein
VKYKQTTPAPGYKNGSYTHTIYYGDDAFRQLEADVPLLERLPADTKAGDRQYWKERWEAISYHVNNWLDLKKDPTARAIILHRQTDTTDGVYGHNWNSIYLASRTYIERNTNCSLVANEYVLIGRGDPKTNAGLPFVQGVDEDYLMTLKQQLFEKNPGAPSPGMNTGSIAKVFKREAKYVFSE